MPNVSGVGTVWNLPNYIGEIYTASFLQTPVLSMSGGLNGTYSTDNFEFPIDQTYEHEAAAQPAITETASLTAPTAITYVRSQDKNVTQIYQASVLLSYAKLSNMGRVTGIATSGAEVTPIAEVDWQILRVLEGIARNVEFTTIRGTYNLATNAGQANKSRGLNEAAGTAVNASSATLSKPLMQSLLRAMFDAGAVFKNPVIVVNSFQKQILSNIYGYAPADRNIGGLNVKQIETDFCTLGVVLDPFQDTAVVGVYDMPFVKIVSQPVPGKGHLFYEPLAKTGASEPGQIYGQIGLDHGPAFMHGRIYGLATS